MKDSWYHPWYVPFLHCPKCLLIFDANPFQVLTCGCLAEPLCVQQRHFNGTCSKQVVQAAGGGGDVDGPKINGHSLPVHLSLMFLVFNLVSNFWNEFKFNDNNSASQQHQ